jgi:pescadillo
MPHDVDFKVMSTFLEIHETLISFVNYKLYSEMNLVYPPKLDSAQLDSGAGMDAYMVECRDESVMQEVKKDKQFSARLKTLESKLDTIEENEDDEEIRVEVDDDQVEESAPEPIVAPTTVEEQVVSMSKETGEKRLLEGCTIWLSREVPRYSLEFIIKSAGGKVGWDETAGSGSQFKIDDTRITHQITDRPLTPGFNPTEGREHLQPQWIYDCINANKLLKTEGYHPGEKLPPHLSPFVVAGVDDYSPENPVQEAVLVEEEVFFILFNPRFLLKICMSQK